MRRLKSGGGWAAVKYTLRMANRVRWWRLWNAMSTRNTCKTCALGMGGQQGGMRNEQGHWPEVCKKSLQAMVADMQDGLRPEFFERYSIADLKTLSPRELEWSGRIAQPVFAGPGDTHYRVLSWEDAYARIVRQLADAGPQQNFFYCSGRSSNEAAFLLQLFARLYGTNYVNNCSYYCHQASGVALNQALGTGTATVTLEDVEDTDLFILIGGNPASNHPRLMRTLMNIRRRGGHVIVINPIRELGLVNFSVPSDVRSLLFGSEIASQYVQPHIGGDIPLLAGVAKALLERRLTDAKFLNQATEGFAGFAEEVRALDWDEIVRRSGVSREDMEQIALTYGRARTAVFGWTMGITHHLHGSENVRMIVNLALMRGMIGRPGAGLLPIRGHSNVQGIGSMGVAPALKQQIIDRLEELLGVSLPTTPGLDTMACMEAAAEGRVRGAICLGGNLFGSNPDAKFAHRAFANLDLVTYVNTTLNTGHAWGLGRETLILPALARDEEPQPTTQESMFNFVRFSDGGPSRVAEAKSEVEIITTLAERLLADSPVNWRDMRELSGVRAMIARIIPGYEAIGSVDVTRKEFQIGGRTFHQPVFPTADGRARFSELRPAWEKVAQAAAPSDSGPGGLRLMTIRSEGQFNTVVYEDEDIYRGQDRRDIILMNSDDIARLGLAVDQRVRVSSPAGEMRRILVRDFDIRAGNAAMYLPEANVLVPRDVDQQSKTPGFKSVWITLSPDPASEDSLAGAGFVPLEQVAGAR
ncbi:MAG: FdhF/YdeP family oxidoreductase [Planctomyces sp.]|nr:FdhF/YdeP family oxidoreductase [Planctomyces sp.]